jgi:DNA-binding response OmpR family regulator
MKNNMDILIIDDDDKLTEILSALLQYNGFQVHAINDSSIAFSTIKALHPKIIILDLMMPEIDGLKILKSIKDDPELGDIKIIVYSGKAFEVDKKLAMQYGADEFLTKPAKAKILLEKIHHLLEEYAR